MFHAKGGWHFHRLPDGGVRISKQVPVIVHDEFGYVADREHPGRFVVVDQVDVDAGTWASIVASVSKGGETGESFHAAEELHAT